MNNLKDSKGAIMSQIVLADEINRTSPKTQASLLEAMEEKQVTVDGNIVTGKGPAFAMKFTLQLVETLVGKAKRDEVASGLLL